MHIHSYACIFLERGCDCRKGRLSCYKILQAFEECQWCNEVYNIRSRHGHPGRRAVNLKTTRCFFPSLNDKSLTNATLTLNVRPPADLHLSQSICIGASSCVLQPCGSRSVKSVHTLRHYRVLHVSTTPLGLHHLCCDFTADFSDQAASESL